MVTRLAVNDREPSRKVTAREVASELVLDILRQWRSVLIASVLQEVPEMFLHQAVQDRFLRPARQVRGGEAGHVAAIALAMPSRPARIS